MSKKLVTQLQFNELEIKSDFILPDEFKGEILSNGGYTINNPRRWTVEEIDWVNMLKNKGLTIKQIANCIDRDFTQVSIKIKRLSKKYKTYNLKHFNDKYYYNELFLKEIKPKTVLDLYSGYPSFYDGKVDELYSNDINKSFATYYSEKADRLCAKLWYDGYKFDLIDIDPFGSAYDCFDLSIKMAKKGLIITFGELGHKRFKRLDYVSRYYDITDLENFNIDNMVNHVIKIGLRNKKILNPLFVRDWTNIGRVYFKIINK